MARELKIVYGSLTVGAGTTRELDGYTTLMMSHGLAEFEFSFLTADIADTAAAFAAECQAVEDAFRTPYQDFEWTLGSDKIRELDQSQNTGLDAQPEILKRADVESDSGRRRRYTIRIRFGLPADTGAEPAVGLRDAKVAMNYTLDGRRVLTMSGVWTASGANDARAQYAAAATAWANGRITALGGTYKLVEHDRDATTNQKELRFRRVYEEIDANRLRTYSVSVALSPAKVATVTISGRYYGTDGGDDARSTFEGAIDALASSVFTALSITNYEFDEQTRADEDTQNETLDFERVYRELIHTQAGASLDDADLVRQNVEFSRNYVASDSTDVVDTLTEWEVSYDVWIDKDQSTDLPGKWDDVIQPWILGRLNTLNSGGSVMVESDNPTFLYDENRISGRLRALGRRGTNVIRSLVTSEDQVDTGVVLVPVWATNAPLSKYGYQGPATKIRRIIEEREVVADLTPAQAEVASVGWSVPVDEPLKGTPGGLGGGGGRWVLRSRHMSNSRRRRGVSPDTYQVTVISVTALWEFYEPVNEGTGL